MEDRVGARDVYNGTVRENELHAPLEHLPLEVPIEGAGHETPPPQQVIAKHFRLVSGQAPFTHLDGVEPGPVVDLISILEIHRLFDRAHLNAGQPSERLGKLPICRRIVLSPEGEPLPPVTVEPPAIAVIRARRKHQPGEGPLGLLLPVLRYRVVAVFDRGILPERALESTQRAHKSECPRQSPQSLHDCETHRLVPRISRGARPRSADTSVSGQKNYRTREAAASNGVCHS